MENDGHRSSLHGYLFSGRCSLMENNHQGSRRLPIFQIALRLTSYSKEGSMGGRDIAVIGAGMIGAAHASAYRQFAHRFSKNDFRLKVICDTNENLARDLAKKFGFESVVQDWKEVIADEDIGIISICLPNFLHTIVTQAALDAGKHVLCEKPLALDSDAARLIRNAAAKATCISGTVFNYRRIPAIADIKERIARGEIGDPVQISVKFQCDYAADPMLPHSWRYEFSKAGPGALLDIGTHAIDTMRFLFGDISEVIGAAATISIPKRNLPLDTAVGHGHVALSNETAKVDNDDVMSGLIRFANGAQGYISASRVAVGMGNCLSIEVCGTKGTARFTTEQPSHFELAVFDGRQPANFVRIPNRPSSPAISALAAVPHDMVSIGYSEVFGFLIHEFLTAIDQNKPLQNGSIEDGYRATQVLEAIQQSSVENKAVAIDWQD